MFSYYSRKQNSSHIASSEMPSLLKRFPFVSPYNIPHTGGNNMASLLSEYAGIVGVYFQRNSNWESRVIKLTAGTLNTSVEGPQWVSPSPSPTGPEARMI